MAFAAVLAGVREEASTLISFIRCEFNDHPDASKKLKYVGEGKGAWVRVNTQPPAADEERSAPPAVPSAHTTQRLLVPPTHRSTEEPHPHRIPAHRPLSTTRRLLDAEGPLQSERRPSRQRSPAAAGHATQRLLATEAAEPEQLDLLPVGVTMPRDPPYGGAFRRPSRQRQLRRPLPDPVPLLQRVLARGQELGGVALLAMRRNLFHCIMYTLVPLLVIGVLCLAVSILRNPDRPGASTGAPTYDCETAAAQWGKVQQDWCCDHRGLGCPSFDCQADLAIWEFSWSPGKAGWCCQNKGLGCSSTVPGAIAPPPDTANPPAAAATRAPAGVGEHGPRGLYEAAPTDAPPVSVGKEAIGYFALEKPQAHAKRQLGRRFSMTSFAAYHSRSFRGR